MEFVELVHKVREQRDLPQLIGSHVLICFDPGHTTGWALFIGYELAEAGQIDTSDIGVATREVSNLWDMYDPNAVVMEDYRVYKWRAKHHVGSEMLTTRVIGSIETIAVQHYVDTITKQPAHVAKGFCTDTKLREWGFYKKGEKHARDAIRHGAYYLLFGPVRKSDKTNKTVG